ncbi:type II toxin-antitoxin system RelE/ParE family toxin [Desulfonatronum lacustre]|uniref:type II toxin-antitoxin system RelE/ParE family toxin n=1 Tax=Desulfonatronum lacustre TaxID=66849 RepID=UPI000A0053F9
MLILRWTLIALADFEHAHDYVAQDNSESARRIAQRIMDATKKILRFPRIGRVGEDEETREYLVPKTPYMLIYSINGDTIELLRVWHMSQKSKDFQHPPLDSKRTNPPKS